MLLSQDNSMSISQRISELNWRLISLIFALSCVGLLMLYSAAGGSIYPWLIKQLIFLIIFFPLMIFIAITDIKFWFKSCYILYAISLIFLLAVDIKGHNAMGATRWFKIGGITLQPSEPAKLFTILALARYFYNTEVEKIKKSSYILVPSLIISLPVILIAEQPDLGTAVVLLLVGVSVLFMAGVKMWKFIVGGLTALLAVPLLWFFVLYDYQKDRILIFLDPDRDPSGSGYNITQSKIAIGSGGFFGKGYMNGTQGQLDFLPERQTDFIFTMLNEELGFIGGVATIILFGAIIHFGTGIALKTKHQFGKLLAIGVTNLFFLHMFVNMAMVMGLLPVVGIPLPLVSYGGTITATTLIAFGLLLNIDMNQNSELKGKNL